MRFLYIAYASRSPSNSIDQKLRKIHITIIKSQNPDTPKKLTNLSISSNLHNYGMHFNELSIELRDSKIRSTLLPHKVIWVGNIPVFLINIFVRIRAFYEGKMLQVLPR
jgi:hypothetical protein